MTHLHRFVRRSALVLLCCLTACQAQPVETDPASRASLGVDVPPGAEGLAVLWEEIEAEVGVPRARIAAQCRTMGVGVKPCGGPARYVVYSTAGTDVERLEALVAAYNAVEDSLNRALGLVSDCAFVGPPEVRLAGGVCVAGGR